VDSSFSRPMTASDGFREDRASSLYGLMWMAGTPETSFRVSELEELASTIRIDFPKSPSRLRESIVSNLKYLRSCGLVRLETSKDQVVAASVAQPPIGQIVGGLDAGGFLSGSEAARRSGRAVALPFADLRSFLNPYRQKGANESKFAEYLEDGIRAYAETTATEVPRWEGSLAHCRKAAERMAILLKSSCPEIPHDLDARKTFLHVVQTPADGGQNRGKMRRASGGGGHARFKYAEVYRDISQCSLAVLSLCAAGLHDEPETRREMLSVRQKQAVSFATVAGLIATASLLGESGQLD